MRKRRILIGLSLLKPISTIGDKNNLSRGGRGETRTGTFFRAVTGGTRMGVKGRFSVDVSPYPMGVPAGGLLHSLH